MNGKVSGNDRSSGLSKENTLQLKGIAILMLLMHHLFLEPEMYQGYSVIFAPFSEELINQISGFGKICVSIFAFLSAYGLYISWKNWKKTNNNVKEWYYKRLIVLYKNYWFVFVLSFIICTLFGKITADAYFSAGNGVGIFQILIDFAGLTGFFGTPSINGAWWYMSIALTIILLVPLLDFLMQKMGGGLLLLTVILLPRLFGVGFQGNNSVLPFLFAPACAVVAAEYDLFSTAKKKTGLLLGSRWLPETILFLMLSAVLAVLFHLYRTIPLKSYYEFHYGFVPVVFIIYCFRYWIRIPGLRQVLTYLGKQSMNIFYLHIFLRLYYAVDFIYSFRHFVLILVALLVSTILCSYALEWLKKLMKFA